MPKGNKPKYYLKLTDKRNTKQRTMAGVAFENEFKQLSIVLNPGVTISWNDEMFITLNLYDDDHPNRSREMPPVKRKESDEGDAGGKGGGGDDDIPF